MYLDRPVIARSVSESMLQRNREFVEDKVNRLTGGVRGMGQMISFIYRRTLEFLIFDPEVEQSRTWEMWLTSMQYHHAFYQVSLAEPGVRSDCLVGGRMLNLGSPPLNSAVNASSWLGLLHTTLTCRAGDRVRFLAGVPVEVLRSAGESQGSRYMTDAYATVEAWQAFVLGSPEAGELVERARGLAVPERARFAADEAEMVAVPELDVLGRLVAGDGPGFNEALVRALESYREYTAEDLASGGTRGILPVGLLALACLARDGVVEGVSLEVESDYLPAGIVNGTWLDAFPV